MIQFNYIEGHLIICEFHLETQSVRLSQRNGFLIFLWVSKDLSCSPLPFSQCFCLKTVPFQSHSHAPTFKGQCHSLSPKLVIVLSSYMNFVLACNSINHLFALLERGKGESIELKKNYFQKPTRCSFSLDYIRFLLTQGKGIWKIIISP